MSIFNISGSRLTSPYLINGSKVSKVYSLSGSLIQSRNESNEFVFSEGKFPNSGWKFKKISNTANTSYTSTAESAIDYDDSSQESVSIPHDWSIYNNFNSNSASTYEGGFLDGGDAWYRYKFTLTDKFLSDQTLIYFDGVYMEADVYFNGKLLKSNKMGYNPFYVDISHDLIDGENVLAVFVRNQQPSSRWYSGSGIYRPVYLIVMKGVGKYITDTYITSPELESQYSSDVTTNISFSVYNTDASTTAKAIAMIYKDESLVASSEKDIELAEDNTECSIDVTVNKPALQDVGQPNLYTAKIILTGDFGTYTSKTITFGYRWTKWDVDTGFWLNGQNIKLKGVCMHHDLGCIGAEANRSAMERQIDSMVAMGANAIRLTHNPSSTMFLDLCMRKGVILVEELFDHWTVAKSKYDFARYYSEHYKEVIRDTMLRDRNNPAIVMWSLGNEINRTAKYTAEQVEPIVTALITEVKKYDATRPVTMGEDSPSMDAAKVCMQLLDVCGINYTKNDLSIPHGLGKPSYGSETTSALSSRGVYARDNTNLQCSSYDDDVVSWGSLASAALKAHMSNEYSGGMFVWTGWDYIGEPTPFNKYPAKSSYFGIVDTAGFPKDIYYMYQSQQTTSPMIHILPRNWDSQTAGDTVKVQLYSNCASVELYQDGVSLGKKEQAQIGSKCQFEYSATYAKGSLIAKGYDADGNVVATDEVKTSDGTPFKLKLSAYKDSVDITTDDLVFITCDILDKDDTFVPTASNSVSFSCTGGTVLGTDNGNAACIEPMRTNVKSAFNGKVLCVCQHDKSAGNLVITANSDGLEGTTITITKK